MELFDYRTESGSCPIRDYLKGLKDNKAKVSILTRLQRLKAGNFGNCRAIGESVWELKIDIGAGYRIYYSLVGTELVILLLGGDKKTQQADIEKAIQYLKDWKRRNKP